MTSGATVLVVDDEAALRRVVGAGLQARGYRVLNAETGQQAIDAFTTQPPDVVILDLGLPDLDGIEVCRRVRESSSVPIIVLSAEGADDRKVLALDAGADDYVTKPFSMPELLARIRVALRHASATGGGGPDDAVLRVGDLTIDVARHEARLGNDRLDLTPKEFGFLALLARHPGRVLTHQRILRDVWGPGYGKETQYLRVYASQLRKKLDDDPTHPRLVTEPGVGYRLLDPRSEPD